MARFLIRQLKLRPIRFAAAAAALELASGLLFLVTLRIQLGPSALSQLRSSLIALGSEALWLTWTALFAFVLTPSVWAAYLWISKASAELFQELTHGDVFEADADALHSELSSRIESVFRNPFWTVASILISVLVAGLFGTGAIKTWQLNFAEGEAAFLIANLPVWMLGWYMVCQIAAREISVIYGLVRLFGSHHVLVRPFHPDRCGGLGPLNRYAIGFAYVLAVFAFTMVTLGLLSAAASEAFLDRTARVILAIYLIGAPLCFFGSIGVAHGPMKRARDALVAQISDRFTLEYQELENALATGTELSDVRERVDALRGLHDMARSFPVWPFDAENLRRFGASVCVPLLPIVWDVVKGKVVGFF